MDESNDFSEVLGLVLNAVKSSISNKVDMYTQCLQMLSELSLNFFSLGFYIQHPPAHLERNTFN